MNPFSYEAELLALAIALYLYDSSVLLFANEAVLINRSGTRWQLKLPLERLLLAGRSFCLLNPFTPQAAAFRLSFSFERLSTESVHPEWALSAAALKPLKVASCGCALGLFGLLPLALFTPLSLFALIPALVLLYGSALYGLARLFAARQALHLSLKRYLAFAAECIFCPPFAVNMVRRLSLAQGVQESLPSAGARLLAPDEWRRLAAHCEARLEGEQKLLEAGSLASQRIEASKQALKGMAVAP